MRMPETNSVPQRPIPGPLLLLASPLHPDKEGFMGLAKLRFPFAIAVASIGLALFSRSANAGGIILPPPPDPAPITFSVYGDSLVYRSGWDCGGLPTEQCDALKADASFVSYPPTQSTREYRLVTFDGRGGSTCLPRTGDVGLLARIIPTDQRFVAILIGINDVNSVGTSVADTVACLTSAWAKIANQLGRIPVAITYPSFSRSIWSGVSDSVAFQRRAALNAAIVQAAFDFNINQPFARRVRVLRFDRLTDYDPTPGLDTFDGVHPNPDGAAVLGHAFYAAMIK
jgi:lysophospholipase L1-like esterase